MVVMVFNISPRDDLIWMGIDLDGTLAEAVWPDPGIGAPIARNVAKLNAVVSAGYKVVIHTSRPWSDYELIESWLNHHLIPFNTIVCGKLLVHRYVDDRAVHSEEDSWLT